MPTTATPKAQPPGLFKKYDGDFKQEIGQVDGGPEDLIEHTAGIMGQYDNKCAAGRWCKISMPLSTLHRCMSCAFATHPECAVELTGWRERPSLTVKISLVCKGCVGSLQMESDIIIKGQAQTIAVEHPKLKGLVRTTYPSLKLDAGVDLTREEKLQQTLLEQRATEEAAETKKRVEAKTAERRKNKADKANKVTPAKAPPTSSGKDTPEDAMDVDDPRKPAATEDAMNEDDGSHSTATNTNKQKQTQQKEPPPPPKEAEKKYKGYIGVQLVMEPLAKPGSVGDAVKMVIAKCHQWMSNIQEITPTFKLHTADPEGEVQTTLHSLTDFPKDLGTLKNYFFGARPLPKGGRLYLKVLTEFEGNMKEFIQNVKWFHDNAGERIYECQVQAFQTKIPCFLLYSTRNLDVDRLKEELSDKIPELKGYHLAWKRIPDGTYAGGRDTSKDPKALLLEVDSSIAQRVKKTLSVVYGNTATEWPLGIRMRYVSAITDLVSLKSIERFHFLRNRQAGWIAQMQSVTLDSVVNIDRPHAIWPEQTLRKTLMAIPSTTGNIHTGLFSGVDKPWKGTGHIINFHPQKATEARAALAGLYARFSHQLTVDQNPALREFFTPEAVTRGEEMTWNSETNEAHSPADQAIDDLIAMDADMDFEAETPDVQVIETFQQDKWGTDAATLDSAGTKATRPNSAKKPVNAIQPKDDASDASSLTAGTKATMISRISTVEHLIAGQSDAIQAVLQLVQGLSAPSAHTTPPGAAAATAPPVTPTDKPRNGDDVATNAGPRGPAPV